MKQKANFLLWSIGGAVVCSSLLCSCKKSEDNQVSSAPATPATNVVAGMNAKTNAAGEESNSKKYVDPKTGQCALVGLDNRTVTLKNKNGNVIWTVDLVNEVQKYGSHELPTDIRWVGFSEPGLILDSGAVVYLLDVHTGKAIDVERRHHIP